MIKRLLSLLLLYLTLFFGAYQITKPKNAWAQPHQCVCNCGCCTSGIQRCSTACGCTSTRQTEATRTHITNEFIYHREWLTRIVWEMHLLPAMLLMTDQITTVAVTQTMAIGTLFDAKHQLESQRLLQTMQAQAHKDYQPSEGVCTFGTNTRALAASDQNANTVDIALSTQGMARQLISGDTISASGGSSDRESRWVQFKETYCNPGDNSNGFDALCAGTDASRYNKDIDFTQTIAKPYTLELDFTAGGNVSEHEEDVFALQSNLYAHRLVPNFSDLYFMATRDDKAIDLGSFLYMDMRSLTAQRQVAMASYHALASMKSQGDANVQPYMQALFEEMGMEEAQAQELLGARPSYYAQMELLTKKLYQNPNFYTDLYDKPVNIDRKEVAMQAISLMQKRDMYDSLLRSEMSQSIWLETALEQLQDKYTNQSASEENPIIREVLRALP